MKKINNTAKGIAKLQKVSYYGNKTIFDTLLKQQKESLGR